MLRQALQQARASSGALAAGCFRRMGGLLCARLCILTPCLLSCCTGMCPPLQESSCPMPVLTCLSPLVLEQRTFYRTAAAAVHLLCAALLM